MRRKPKRQQSSVPQYIVDHYGELKSRLHDQETKFDNAVLLVAGGAFTVSAAIVATLKPPLESTALLAISWTAWALCLLTLVLGYLFSVKATCIVLDQIDDGVYDGDRLTGGWRAKLIPVMNKLSFWCLIVGFAGFGGFLFDNVTRDQHGNKEVAQHESKTSNKETQRQAEGLQKGNSGVRVQPAAPAAIPQVGDQRERQDKKPTR